MPHFLLRLAAPRPTFPFDATPAEKALMDKHGDYWRAQAKAGAALAVGPVFDPAGPWGMALVEAADETAAAALGEADPVIQAGAGFRYSVFPVPNLILRQS